MFDNFTSGDNIAKCIRAVLEPMVAYHFGEEIIDELVSRYVVNVARHILKEKAKYVNFIIPLKKLQ